MKTVLSLSQSSGAAGTFSDDDARVGSGALSMRIEESQVRSEPFPIVSGSVGNSSADDERVGSCPRVERIGEDEDRPEPFPILGGRGHFFRRRRAGGEWRTQYEDRGESSAFRTFPNRVGIRRQFFSRRRAGGELPT